MYSVYKVLEGKRVQGRGCFVVVGVDGRMILKWIATKEGLRLFTGFMSFSTDSDVVVL
jgi:hypothetical protein